MMEKQQFDKLCRELNLDDATARKAWDLYKSISENYSLEGDRLTWLTCAVYAASITPIVCNGTMEGNGTSLTRLLKYSKVSLFQFFPKMKNWCDMANLPRKVYDKVDRLQRNFDVSAVIFEKFLLIFRSIFNFMAEEPTPQRSQKQRSPPPSCTEVLAFCWDLFVLAKSNFPAMRDNLVNLYYLLLCCVDLLFANALFADRKKLLHPHFEGLPDGFHSDRFEPPDNPPCIIDQLCRVHGGQVIEAKGIKEQIWKPYLTKKFDKQVLHGDVSNLSGLLDPANFDTNWKNIKREYDEYVLQKADFDERVFLEEDVRKQIGTLSQTALHLEKHSKILIPQTPLTNRRYLQEKVTHTTPVSTATQMVSRLQALLSGQKNCPSENLSKVCQNCKENPEEAIVASVKDMGQLFCEKYTQPSDDGTGSPTDFAKRRLSLAEILYFSCLEKITENEIKRLSDKQDLSGLLGHKRFHRCLFACCLEIIIFAYNSQREFPWILDVFDLHGYYFYGVIEILLRAEDGLPRDIVKHLSRIEEMILQEKAWTSDSPLWRTLDDCYPEVPMCADCTPLNQIEVASPNQGSVMPQSMMSPMRHKGMQELSTAQQAKDVLMSPVSARDIFSSPAPGSAKLRLFSDDAPTAPPTVEPVVTPASNTNKDVNIGNIHDAIPLAEPGQTSLLVTTGGHQGGLNTVMPQAKVGHPPLAEQGAQSSSVDMRPKSSGSLEIFFRKVYRVLNSRLRDMCAKLSINEDVMRKIWTFLEYSIVKHVNLMKDRNVDQLLLCAIYFICKDTNNSFTFDEIIKNYRCQPQADSQVYRSVLLCRKDSPQKGPSTGQDKALPQTPENQKEKILRGGNSSLKAVNSAPPTPTRMSGTSTAFENEERGDLVAFYNSIYLKEMGDHAKKLVGAVAHGNVTVSPLSLLPKVRTHRSSTKVMTYVINKSPSKNLKDINRMLHTKERVPTKRALQMDATDSPSKMSKLENNFGLVIRLLTVQSINPDDIWFFKVKYPY